MEKFPKYVGGPMAALNTLACQLSDHQAQNKLDQNHSLHPCTNIKLGGISQGRTEDTCLLCTTHFQVIQDRSMHAFRSR